LGVALEGQAYGRLRLGEQANLLARMTGTGRLYGDGAFDDVALRISTGPELRLGADRLTAEAGATWRWFGGKPYSTTAIAMVNYFHPLDRRSQLRVLAAFGLIDNRRSRLQDGRSETLSLSYERALSGRAGIAITLSGERYDLRDPAYSIRSMPQRLSLCCQTPLHRHSGPRCLHLPADCLQSRSTIVSSLQPARTA